MKRSLMSLVLIFLGTACVTPGHIDSHGYTHEKLGYRIAFANADAKEFLPSGWKLEVNKQGQPYSKDNSTSRVDVKSINDHKDYIYVRDLDLIWKHRQTNGMIGIRSMPLSEELAERKLPVLAKDQVEHMSGFYFASIGHAAGRARVSRNLVTNIIESKAGMLGSAETYEVVVDIANAEQLKLNPEHRLMRYKMVLIKPKASEGWKDKRNTQPPRLTKADVKDIEETYPALIVLTYVMDHAYYQDYVADFEALVSRVKLRS